MNIQEAYKVLETSDSISDDDLKKKWRLLAKKYHPDVNKDHPEKLKEINEAYQFIKEYRENPPQENISFNMNDIFSHFQGFGRRQERTPQRDVDNIQLEQEITFEESILGVEKEINVQREVKCENCNGQGFKQKKNGCNHCDGFGHSTINRGNAIFSTTCSQCNGRIVKDDCIKCDKKSFINTNVKMKVKIPAGICDKNIMQLRGAGHYVQQSPFGDAYSNILITINVKNETKLRVEDQDVIFNLNISLLEAIEGCSKIVPSIKGNQTIEVPANSKNKEEIILNNLGVNLQGNERIILDVSYPENKEKLISILKEGK